MDMVKEELEDNHNPFELSCVELEIEEIESELVNFASNCFSWNIYCEFVISSLFLFQIKYSFLDWIVFNVFFLDSTNAIAQSIYLDSHLVYKAELMQKLGKIFVQLRVYEYFIDHDCFRVFMFFRKTPSFFVNFDQNFMECYIYRCRFVWENWKKYVNFQSIDGFQSIYFLGIPAFRTAWIAISCEESNYWTNWLLRYVVCNMQHATMRWVSFGWMVSI